MTVLTAIPYYGVSEELINKAVRCALAQTVKDHVVLVAGDGQEPPVTIRDPRLVVVTLKRNRGAPFTQQAMILGSPYAWYAPHGADDWAEPEYLQALLDIPGPAKGEGRIRYQPVHSTTAFLVKSKDWAEFGLFSTRTLLSVGGYAANEPCGQDSLLLAILRKTVGIRTLDRALYHKVGRADSLTESPGTGFGSPVRLAVRERNQQVVARLTRIGWANVGAIRAYRESLIPLRLRAELYDAANEIDRALAAQRIGRPAVGPPPQRARWIRPETKI